VRHLLQGNAELTFNYLTTAWEMVAPFACPCGALNCYDLVAGCQYLTLAWQVFLAPQCSSPLRHLWRAHATQPQGQGQ
jgi:hypothetical protein